MFLNTNSFCIVRYFAPIVRRFAHVRRFAAVMIFGFAVVACPRPSFAVDPAVVEIAVGAFVAGGAAIGIPIDKDEVALITPLVQCIADGQRVIDCPKKLLIAQLPREAQTFVSCVTDTRDVALCGQNEVFRRLPPEARQLADCIAKSDAVDCAKRLATGEAEKAALGVITRLNDEVKNPLGEVITPIQNIVGVVEAVARGEWDKVLLNGGKAVAKYAVRIVLTALLTEAGSFVAGPVIDVLIESRLDLAINLITALKAKDAPRIAEILVEAYLLADVQITCALIPSGAIHEAICGTAGKIIQAIGGVAGDGIRTAVDIIKDPLSIGDDLKSLFNGGCGSPAEAYANNFPICYHRGAYLRITDPAAFPEFERWLNQTGCRDAFIKCNRSTVVNGICKPAHDMFNSHTDQLAQALINASNIYVRSFVPYMESNGFACDRNSYQKGVDRFISECENALQNQIPLSGDAAWEQCRPSSTQQLWGGNTAAKAACSKAVGSVALNPANVVNETDAAAAAYTKAFRWYAATVAERICKPEGYTPEIRTFIDMCAASLKTEVSACGSPEVLKNACRTALTQIDFGPQQVVAEVCATTPAATPPRPIHPSRCFEGMIRNATGHCACPAGEIFRGQRCVRESQSASPFVSPTVMPPIVPPIRPREVICSDGSRVPAGSVCPPVRTSGVQCPDGAHVSDYERCRKRCPDGSVVLVRDQCPVASPRTRQPSGVLCPDGSRATHSEFCNKRCPDGRLVQAHASCTPPQQQLPPSQRQPGGFLCSDGSRAPAKSLCRRLCQDGRSVLMHESCPSPQQQQQPPAQKQPTGVHCPDGSRAPSLSKCHKRCANGRVVLLWEACTTPSRPPATKCPAGTVPDSTGFCGPR